MMSTLGQALRSITIHGSDVLVKIRWVLVGTVAIGLGVLFGVLIDSFERGELIISIVIVLITMIITINKPLNGLLVLLFFKAFFMTKIKIPMGAGVPDLSFTRFTIAFLAIFMLARAAIGKFRFARISLAEICILATPIGIVIAVPLSVTGPKAVMQWALDMYFTPLVMYFFAKNLVRDKKDLHKLFLVIALFGFAAGAYAAYEHATGHVLLVPKGKETYKLWREALGIRQIRGLMDGSGNMGRILATAIPITFYLFLERKKTDILKILLIVMLAVQFYGIVIAMSRTPWYALLIALFVMQFFYPQFRKVFIVISIVAAIVIWVTWDQVTESQVAARVNDKVSTMENREMRWQAGYNMWKVKPIRGWGFGQYGKHSGRFRTGSRANYGAVENDYLYLLVASGLIGFLPYAIFLLAPLVNSLRLFFRARAPDWPGFIGPGTIVTYWGVFLCLAITSYTALQTHSLIKMCTFAVAGGVIGTHEYLLQSSKDRKRSLPPMVRRAQGA